MKKDFTLCNQFARIAHKFSGNLNLANRLKAFTLAEVLITLAVIGIVSAIVIPSVIKNYNDKKYNTARLKALKTFGEAGKMASINGEMNSQSNATDFVNNVLSKYLKIVKVCDNTQPENCEFPKKIKNLRGDNYDSVNIFKTWQSVAIFAGTSISSPLSDTEMTIFVLTADGYSAKLFYNPKCARNFKEIGWNCSGKSCSYHINDAACLNIVYDMNGKSGPNHIGEDIGIVTVFWSGLQTRSVAPGIIPYDINTSGETLASQPEAQIICANKGTKAIPYALSNIDELSALYINNRLIFMPYTDRNYMSSSPIIDKAEAVWYLNYSGFAGSMNKYSGWVRGLWCVRR